jgi:hypothetical protein
MRANGFTSVYPAAKYLNPSLVIAASIAPMVRISVLRCRLEMSAAASLKKEKKGSM